MRNYQSQKTIFGKTQTNTVISSSIVPRHYKLNKKATRVNKRLKEECEARNVLFTTETFLQSITVTEVSHILIMVELRN